MVKKKYFYSFILLIILLVNSSCSNSKYSQSELDDIANNVKDNYTQPYMNGSGVSLGLYNIEGKIEETKLFTLKENESLKKIIALGNMVDNERTYKILLFVDFKQSFFLVNGKEVIEYDFKSEQNQYNAIPVEIKNLPEGFHDIFFVIVKYSDIKSLDEEFRNNTDMNNLLFIRFDVVVENSSSMTTNFESFDNSKEAVFDGVFLSKENDKLKRWSIENIGVSKPINFNIHVGNKIYNEQQHFALITLLDWKQVDFYNNQDIVFFNVKKGTQIYIPSSINAPDKQGVYDLVSILIYNPYEPLTIKNSDIGTGIRVGINVK